MPELKLFRDLTIAKEINARCRDDPPYTRTIMSTSFDPVIHSEKTDISPDENHAQPHLTDRKTLSVFTAGIVLTVFFLMFLTMITAFPRKYPMDNKHVDRFVTDTMNNWKKKYGAEKGLKVARIDVHFNAAPKDFVNDEGVVIVPVGIDLPKGQTIIATATYPPHVRELTVDGIKSIAWAYPGHCRTDMNLTALTLVRQNIPLKKPIFLSTVTTRSLPRTFLSDMLVHAKEIEEHNLSECEGFKEWADHMDVKGTHVDRFKAIVEKIAKGIKDKNDDAPHNEEDICASTRESGYSVHTAHVLTVMAARELNIPCNGFISASSVKNAIAGTYSDQTGWIFYDLSNPKKGFFTDPPVLLTLTPMMSEFEACHDKYWDAAGGGYKQSGWGMNEFTYTSWGEKNMKTDYTLARTIPLDTWTGKP